MSNKQNDTYEETKWDKIMEQLIYLGGDSLGWEYYGSGEGTAITKVYKKRDNNPELFPVVGSETDSLSFSSFAKEEKDKK
jgi:hypothetical protein